MKIYSLKIEGKVNSKAYPLHTWIASTMSSNPEKKPLDAVLDLLLNGSSGVSNITIPDLKLDNIIELEKYGSKTESELVTEMFVKDGQFDIEMVKKCLIAVAKADYSRQQSGTQWHNREDRQAAIDEIVVARMAKNDEIDGNQWFKRELINSKWISVNCSTSVAKAIEYLASHNDEIETHNQKIRMVNGKDLGRYFNRSARSALKKWESSNAPAPEPKPKAKAKDKAKSIFSSGPVVFNDNDDGDYDDGDYDDYEDGEVLGADGVPL
ncbi:MAG: hypothetical protein VSS75_033700 [Candidatus Parabeggiatoa sp.]|nr:hypothetical protein [Candidatus Parabeggiatoa sp.]